jgi:sugar lactone lactonase YvrE
VTALVCDNSGNILIADGPNSAVRRVSPDGVISTLVGGKKAAQTGALKWPNSLAIDNQGDLLIGDTSDYRVFRFSPGKVLEIVTGSGVNSMTRRVGGENVRPALGAGIGYPWALAVDQAGNTFIGTYSLAWISPDAMLHESLQGNPSSLFLDRDGTLLGTDGNGHIVRYTPLH